MPQQRSEDESHQLFLAGGKISICDIWVQNTYGDAKDKYQINRRILK